MTISDCQLWNESLPLWFTLNWLRSQSEVWTPHLMEPDLQQQAKRGRVVMHLTMSTTYGCFQWSVETNPQLNLVHLSLVEYTNRHQMGQVTHWQLAAGQTVSNTNFLGARFKIPFPEKSFIYLRVRCTRLILLRNTSIATVECSVRIIRT